VKNRTRTLTAIFGGLIIYGLGLKIIRSFGIYIFRAYPSKYIIPYLPIPIASGFWIGLLYPTNAWLLSLILGILIFSWAGFYSRNLVQSTHFWFTAIVSILCFSLGGYLGERRLRIKGGK